MRSLTLHARDNTPKPAFSPKPPRLHRHPYMPARQNPWDRRTGHGKQAEILLVYHNSSLVCMIWLFPAPLPDLFYQNQLLSRLYRTVRKFIGTPYRVDGSVEFLCDAPQVILRLNDVAHNPRKLLKF